MKKKEGGFFKKNILIISIFILILFLITYSYFRKGLIYFLINADINFLVDKIDSFGFWAYLIFFILIILEVVLAPFPPFGLYVAGGILFGAFLGGVIILLGNLIGAGIDFFISKKYGRSFFEKRVNKKTVKLFDKFSKKYGGYSIFLLRLNPFTSSDLFSYIAGLSKMKTSHFLFGTFFGLIPMVFLQTYFGELFIKKNSFLSFIIILLSIIYLVVFAYFIIKSLRKKR